MLTEVSAPGDDFLAGVCEQWEEAAAPVASAGIRLVTIRTGIVLGPAGGVLKQLLLPFRLGLGGRVASGGQWMSWIAIDDEIGAILHALRTDSLSGPVNLTAPNPVTNARLTATLAHVVRRPSKLPTPLLPLRAIFGRELVDTLLVEGQRALPKALEASGYDFTYPTLEPALRGVLDRVG